MLAVDLAVSPRKLTLTASPAPAIPHTCTGKSRWTTMWLANTFGSVTCALADVAATTNKTVHTENDKTAFFAFIVDPPFQFGRSLQFSPSTL